MGSNASKISDSALRFTDVGTIPQRMLAPIEGYENTPLVSLEEAIKPLVSIVPKVERNVYLVKENCKNPEDGLTSDESGSIMLYTLESMPHENSLYVILNDTLRSADRQKLVPWFHYLRLILTALERLPSERRFVVRGIRKDLTAEYPEGHTFVWWGFSSCTSSVKVLECELFFGKKGTRTLFQIDCETGKDIKKHSFVQKEDEILLLPARQFQVTSCLDSGNGLHIIQLKETQPPFSLLEPITLPSSSKQPLKPINILHQPVIEQTPLIEPKKAPTLSPPEYKNAELEKEINEKKNEKQLSFDYKVLNHQDMEIVSYYGVATNKQVLTVLNLSQKQINDQGVQYLANALINNNTLTVLFLQGNQIEDVGAKYLSIALLSNTTLVTLNLDQNRIGDVGAQYLGNMAINNRTLTHLSLYNNPGSFCVIVNDMMSFKRDKSVSSFYVSDHKLDDQGIQLIGNLLKTDTTLSSLTLRGSEIGDREIQYLATALLDNTVNNIHLTLDELDLERNLIGDQGAQYLGKAFEKNNRLVELNLSENRIGDQGALYLANTFKKNTRLTKLDLSKNRIGNQGAQYLNDAFEKSTALIDLDLDENPGSFCATVSALISLKNNKTITRISLSDNQIGDQGAQRLADFIKNNTSLTDLWLDNNRIGDQGAQYLLNALANNKTLTTLKLYGNPSSLCWALDAAISIRHDEKCTRVYLHETQITDQGVQIIADALKNNLTVESLNLDGNQISDYGARYLANVLLNNDTLTELSFKDNPGRICEFVGAVIDIKQDKGSSFLIFNEIGLNDQDIYYLSQALLANTKVRTVSLTDNRIGDQGAQHLANVIESHPTIQSLLLTNNRIGQKGAESLINALRLSSTLTTLRLDGNNIPSNVLARWKQDNDIRRILFGGGLPFKWKSHANSGYQ
ncbi:unnamed protein product [Adineta ricciae]|uniref:NAD(P)(+)--arginine ADP-ribosyltransferase n=1 Tax=Adineta ricciae TaxID=249248 RepID=A0A815YBZ5_ADIRI|nr:unnamed protein product [Adineta ricciae]